MLKRISELLRPAGPGSSQDDALDEVQVAVATLMVEAARMDAAFDADERAVIARLLARRFELDTARTETLIEAAEGKADDNTELYRLSRTIKDAFTHEDRVDLMQMLWEVAYADGEIHSFEANMMRRLTGLVHITDRESGEARKRAQAALDVSDASGGGQ